MKTGLLSTALAGMALTACTSAGSDTAATGTVNVAQAIENPTELTTSLIGSKIRFVPLETTDSSLIGEGYKLGVTGDRAIISNFSGNANVLVFDLNTGKYLNTVGTLGNGPHDYAQPFYLIDHTTGYLFFPSGYGKGYVVYNTDGNYVTTALPQLNYRQAMSLGITDSTLVCFVGKDGGIESRELRMMSYNYDGEPVDSFKVFPGQEQGYFPGSFDGYTKYTTFKVPFANSDQPITQIANQGKKYIVGDLYLTSCGTEDHFRETLCDTIYRLTSHGIEPALIFDMGKNSISISERNRRPITSSDLILTTVTESPDKAVFGVSKGWVGDDDHTVHIGIYDRTTGKTVMGKAGEGIRDDLGGFMPFEPIITNTNGDFIAIITPEEIEEWIAENPDAPRPDWVSTMKPDDNPILVIVSK
ncbi:MAG: DUF4934 domain-containing protein [Paramuribaculum sp.]|nr:DUF4934 domain-containing protein [Paramuribaculum sp.]